MVLCDMFMNKIVPVFFLMSGNRICIFGGALSKKGRGLLGVHTSLQGFNLIK